MMQRIKDAYNALLGKKNTRTIYDTAPYAVTRRQLGSISPDNIQYIREMTEQEAIDHAQEIALIAKNAAFDREIDALIDTQVYWMAQEADGLRQQDFGKGTVNGLCLIKERFHRLESEHDVRVRPKEMLEDLEKYEII